MGTSDSAFCVLWRTFLSQFFASESVTSDVQLRRTLIWVLAFLVTPCLYLTAFVLPTFEIVRLVAAFRHEPEMIEEMLAQLAAIYVSYSMVTTGLIAVFVWDGLNFDRRDAMVIGPLPISGLTVIAAKLAALATLMVGTSLAVNVSAGLPYAFITGSNDGAVKTVHHFVGYLAGTLGGATFVLSTMVAARGLMVLLGGARMTATMGSVLQFVLVSGVLCFFLVPSAMGTTQPIFLAVTAAGWIPTNWYFGLFERLRGSARPELAELSARAVVALLLAMAGAVAITAAGFWRQMQSALAPQQAPGLSLLLRFRRAVGYRIVGKDGVARGVVEFVLMTLSRNREQQTYGAVSAAVAVGIVTFALSRHFTGVDSLMRPRTIVLWVPLVLGYWIAVGLRASFFVPSQLAAAWSFHASARTCRASYWAAVRAVMIVMVLGPAIVVNSAFVAPLLGWKIAGWHALVVISALILLAEILSLTVDFIPYTRVYEPGHAKLKTRWPLYLLGMFLTAYLPVRLELAVLGTPLSVLPLVASAGIGIVACETVGRRLGARWNLESVELADSDAATVLDIGGFSRH